MWIQTLVDCPYRAHRFLRRVKLSAIPYYYIVDFDPDPAIALERLREEVFKSGQYRGYSAKYKSIEELMEHYPPSGTRSILDIINISAMPAYSSACGLKEQEAQYYFGTEKPEIDIVDRIYSLEDFWGDIDRGQAVYAIIYDSNAKPTKYLFAGYSYD